MFKVAVLTISDRCSRDEQKDESGPLIKEIVETINGEVLRYDVIPDEKDLIKEKLIDYSDNIKAELVLTTGGTGLGPRDVTPEATGEIADKTIPGISELIRAEGLKKTQNAALSRATSVVRGRSLIVNLPGSPGGARESLEAILDIIPHALAMLEGAGHP